MSLKLSLRNHYPKVIDRNGRKVKTTMFVFFVSGSPKELEEYSTNQAANLRLDEDTQKMLFFTQNWPGTKTCELVKYKTRDGEIRYQPDTLEKELKIQDIMIVEEAKARVQEDLYGLNQTAPRRETAEPVKQMEVPPVTEPAQLPDPNATKPVVTEELVHEDAAPGTDPDVSPL